ncbi:MAG: hypothetical protein KDC71_22235, partial [Acidobacteria bacterium]|nr:hypothetical protein [Acidobacteriota bacterium]
MAKPVVHFELWSKNPQQVSDFYRNVFEWNIQHIPEMDYHLITPDESGGIGGGIMTPKEGPWPGNMAFYIDVEDIKPYHEKITTQGGKILIPL